MSQLLIDGFIVDAFATGELDWGDAMNQNLSRTGWLLVRAVLTLGGNTPPGGPATNDRHVIGTAPTGAWATHANELTRWNGSAWEFLAPVENLDVRNYGDALTYRWTGGVWVAQGIGNHAATHLPAGADPLLWGGLTGIHGIGPLASRPAASAANANLLFFVTDTYPGGRLFRSDGATWVAIAPSATGNLQQTVSAALAGAASISSTTYANLLSLPITVATGTKLTVWLNLSARNTAGANASIRGRLRVDGAVGDATVAGRGFASAFPLLNSQQHCGLCVQVSGLAAGAHTLFFDWAMGAAASTVSCDPSTNQNTDSADIIAQESLV